MRIADLVIASFCGLPGAGKSTLIREVARSVGATSWLENISDHPFIGDAASSDSARAFLNQADFLVRKMGAAATMQRTGGILHLVEMDWTVCHLLWTGALIRSGRITPAQGAGLQLLYDAGISRGLPPPGTVFHLRTSLETIGSRIERRGRPDERHYATLLGDLQSQEAVTLAALAHGRLHVLDASRSVGELAAAVRCRLEA